MSTNNVIAGTWLMNAHRWMGWVDGFRELRMNILSVETLVMAETSRKLWFFFFLSSLSREILKSKWNCDTYFDGVFLCASQICMITAECRYRISSWSTCTRAGHKCRQQDKLKEKSTERRERKWVNRVVSFRREIAFASFPFPSLHCTSFVLSFAWSTLARQTSQWISIPPSFQSVANKRCSFESNCTLYLCEGQVLLISLCFALLSVSIVCSVRFVATTTSLRSFFFQFKRKRILLIKECECGWGLTEYINEWYHRLTELTLKAISSFQDFTSATNEMNRISSDSTRWQKHLHECRK